MSSADLALSLGIQENYPGANNGVEGGRRFSIESTTPTPFCPTYLHSDTDTRLEDDDSSYLSTKKRIHYYRPLKTDEIRLLILNPGMLNDRIECYLEHYSMNRAKSYEALSYVWGETQESDLIHVDGCPFTVTKNLKSFLASYRTNKTCPVLWIDALCINQNDISERNAQIRLMKRVYEGANSVVIWLGIDTDGTEPAMKKMEYVYKRLWVPRLEAKGSSQEAISSIRARDIQLSIEEIREGCGNVWSDIQDLLQRPWWSRIWVYQEATAPAKCGRIVFCGPYSIQFNKMLAVNKILQHLAARKGDLSLFLAQGSLTGAFMEVYSELRREFHEKGKSSFLRLADLLPTLRGFAATNPRDKLYALIPTSIDGADLLDVDYGLSVEQVYTNAALSFIQKHRNLNILGHCTKSEQGSKITLPSWVPDWTASCAPVHFFKRGVAHYDSDQFAVDDSIIGKLYNASVDSLALVRVDETSTKLFCRGFQYDIVGFVSPSANSSYQAGKISGPWYEWLKGISCDTAEDVFARVLAADCTRLGVDLGCRGYKADLSRAQKASFVSNEEIKPRYERSRGTGVGITGIHPATHRRRLIVLQNHYLGLAAEHVEPGDLVTILMGGQLPMILRRVGSHYIFIGEAFIHGIMDGEALSQLMANGSNLESAIEDFEIW